MAWTSSTALSTSACGLLWSCPSLRIWQAFSPTSGGKNGQRILSLGFIPALATSDPFSDVPPQTAIPVTWQISGNTAPGQPLVYYPLSVASDTTAGLTTDGVVQLLLPQAADIGAPPNDVRSDTQAGVGPKPPRVDDPNFDSMLVTWIRVNVQSSLTLSWAGINAVEIDQRTTYNNVIAGVSDGSANQQFTLAQSADRSQHVPARRGYAGTWVSALERGRRSRRSARAGARLRARP